MPLVAALKSDPLLAPFLKSSCAERGMAATISPAIAPEDMVVISPDGYYNSLAQNRPKSPDCLIVVRCQDGSFTVYVVELRDIAGPNGFEIEEIRAKFNTCLHDFMEGILGVHFGREDIVLRRVRLLFVTDPYNQQANAQRTRFNRSTKMDVLLALNSGHPFYFDGRRLGLEHHYTDPLIQPC